MTTSSRKGASPGREGQKPDTPGRPKSSSRQQIQRDQVLQTGSSALDKASARSAPKDKSFGEKDKMKYRDRPGDEGKHGDGDEEPNAGFP